jgi:CRISPR-associated protein Cmr3
MKLFIEPNDVLMFRDGRPFAGGDDHFARGTFPPSPATIYGALRSHILSHHWSEFDKFKNDQRQIPENVKKEIGTPDELGSLALCQFTLAIKNGNGVEQMFPMPKDVVMEKGSSPCPSLAKRGISEKEELYILNPTSFSGSKTITDIPQGLSNMWHPSEKAMEAASGFLSSKEMGEYLLGKSPSERTPPDKLFDTEERTGIQKSRKTRSVETGRLYSVEYFRLSEKVGFVIEVGNTKLLPESGILRLGGDNRSARYSKASWDWDEILVKSVEEKIAETNSFKLVLTTPAIFKKGWLPEGIDSNTRQGQISGVKVKLIGACVGKPVGIGGYDFVKNHPKVMKKAVPAGSVYYFELMEGDTDSLFKNVWLKSISDEKTQEGFGITLIGGFDYV